MSRTYRNGLEWRFYAHGEFFTYDEYWAIYDAHYRERGCKRYFGDPPPCHGWSQEDRRSKKCRDGKGHNGVQGSAPRWYKEIRRRRERSLVRQAIYHERDMPVFKNSDAWYW